MSAIPTLRLAGLSTQDSALITDPSSWLWTEDAAQRANISVGQVRRLCPAWSRDGLARQTRRAETSQLAWQVHESADPRFARVKSVETLSNQADLTALTDTQRQEVLRRERICQGWDQALAAGTVMGMTREQAKEKYLKTLAAGGDKIGRSTLHRWHGEWRARGREGLFRANWQPSAPDDPFAEFLAEMERWWLDELGQNEPSKKSAFKLARAVARRNGWAIPAYRTACRHLNGISKSRIIHARGGPKAFDDACASYVARDYTRIVVDGQERAMGSNDIWCGDHHICDTIVRHQGKLIRPWLTAWEDLRSRRVFYRFFAADPDSSSVLLAFAAGVRACELSVPMSVYIDNGKDFDAWILQGETKAERKRKLHIEHDTKLFAGVWGILDVKVTHAQPFNAKAKPVERFFGTYESQFGKLTPTYCGRNPEEKPEWLKDKLARGLAPEYEDYVASATRWIEEVYHHEPCEGHGMDGRSPMEVWSANLFEVRRCRESDLDACLQKSSRPVKVGRNGVTWDGRVYGQNDPLVRELFGKEVQLRVDPADITRVSVWGFDGRRLGELAANRLMPFGAVAEEEWKEHTREVRRHNRAMKQASKHGMRLVVDPIDLLAEDRAGQARAAAAAGSAPPQPPPERVIKPIRTGLEQPFIGPQAPAQKLRLAAGSEGIDLLAAADELDVPARRSEAINLLDCIGGD